MRHLKFAYSVVVCLLLSATAYAHHSFSSEYNSKQQQTITGLVTKVEWRNPHIYFYMDVTDGAGKVTEWQLEMGSVQAMAGRGFTRGTLKLGDNVNVAGFRARDGSPLLDVRSIDRADSGEHLLAGRKVQ